MAEIDDREYVELHDRELTEILDETWRIAFGYPGAVTLNMTIQALFNSIAENVQYDGLYLRKANGADYTPVEDNDPATKKYVDDATFGIESTKAETGTVNIGGVVIKWGRVPVDSNYNINVDFDTPFPTACQSVSLVWYGGDNKGGAENLMVKAVTKAVLIISDGGGSDATHIMWQAIGY